MFKGTEGRSLEVLADEVRRGGRFVFYQYCFSVLIMSFKRPSPIYYIPPGQSALTQGLLWSAISFFVGWWGFPWGFIWTPMVIFKNFMGGTDVTPEALSDLGIDLSAPAVAAPAPATLGFIQFLTGPLAGQAFSVPEGGMYIGSAPAQGALTVQDPVVAPQHCWIGPDASGATVLIDTGSLTGTFVVNATASTQVQQVVLQPGDQVFLGGQGGPVFQFGH
ncbi:MAG TPA: FHA domain-containing protein [Symbiobacteriaceae bacterium]|nr:FHA domain-containing protein [Symbiobacteriaceae bacterium]